MTPVIRVDDEVYKALEGQVKGFGDSPNDVLRRLLNLDQALPREPNIASQFIAAAVSQVRFDRSAIEGAILDILHEHNGRVQIVDPVSGFNIYKR